MRRAQDKTGIKANGFSSKQIVAAPEPEPEPEPEAQTNATKKYRIYVDPGNGAPQREPDFVVFNLSDTQDPNDDIMLLHELKEGIRLEFGIEVRTSDHVPFMIHVSERIAGALARSGALAWSTLVTTQAMSTVTSQALNSWENLTTNTTDSGLQLALTS